MGLLQLAFEPLRPLLMILCDLVYAAISIAELVLTLNLSTLLSLSKFRSYWFARFWRLLGPISYQAAVPVVAPLLAQATGVVLDLGTGTGLFLGHFDKTQVTKLYAVETNPGQHAGLLQNAKQAGLIDTVEVMGEPLEQLRGRSGLEYGSVDTVVTVQVLCSVPDLQPLVDELYKYLKPGGRWIVYEHVQVRRDGNGLLQQWQALLDLVWPHLFGGCSLCRDTQRAVEAAGKWTSSSLHAPESDPPTSVIPHVAGILYKA